MVHYLRSGEKKLLDEYIKNHPDSLSYRDGVIFIFFLRFLYIQFGKTIMHIAALASDDVSTMKMLIDRGADINDRDLMGRTPLELA